MPNSTTRELMVDLSEKEVEAYSRELARITTYQQELEDEKKVVGTEFKEKIDRCKTDSRILARKVSTRSELRPVDCRWIKNGNVMELFRGDTNECIDRRPMTEEEKQGQLFEGGE